MRHTIEMPYIRYEPEQLTGRLRQRHTVFVPFEALIETLVLWQSRRCMRRQMARDMRSFNEAMFEDAGTTREEAEREVRKPFWRD